MYGVIKNIYVLLGDLLSMYAVNRSSITACSTGDLNKHLLTDSNKMINYAEIHVYWIDLECDSCSARAETYELLVFQECVVFRSLL